MTAVSRTTDTTVVSQMPQVIIADRLDRHQFVLTNVSATVHVFSKAVSNPNPDISATGTTLRGIKEATSGTGYKVTQSEHYLERFFRGSAIYILTSSRTPSK